MSELFSIRPSTHADAEGILRAHHSAVHGTAKKDYPEQIWNIWSMPVDTGCPPSTVHIITLLRTVLGQSRTRADRTMRVNWPVLHREPERQRIRR
jgi:hypothetical protein